MQRYFCRINFLHVVSMFCFKFHETNVVLFFYFLFIFLQINSLLVPVLQHKPMSEITSGLHRGIYHQGKLRVNRYNPFEAYVGSESIGDEIIVYGRTSMNRAFDGDIVAVELLPQDQWHEEKSLSIADEGMLIKTNCSVF